MTTFISTSGKIEIPEEFRKEDSLKAGQRCDIERIGDGEYRVKVIPVGPDWEPSLYDWLMACPEKDWFVELDRTERTTLERPTLFDE